MVYFITKSQEEKLNLAISNWPREMTRGANPDGYLAKPGCILVYLGTVAGLKREELFDDYDGRDIRRNGYVIEKISEKLGIHIDALRSWRDVNALVPFPSDVARSKWLLGSLTMYMLQTEIIPKIEELEPIEVQIPRKLRK